MVQTLQVLNGSGGTHLTNFYRILPLLLALTYGEISIAKKNCVTKWSQIGDLSVSGLNTSSIQSEGSVTFTVAGAKSSYVLKRNRDGNILAQTPDGNAKVKLCSNGKTIAASATVLGFTKTANITSMGNGNFSILAGGEVYKASVRR